MNRHRRAIESKYKDTCNVYRIENVKDKYNKNKPKEVEVCKDQKCKLSFRGLPMPKKKNNANEQTITPKLFINPEVIIKSGDKIVVIAKERTYSFTAGLPGVYNSHQEVPLEYKEMS